MTDGDNDHLEIVDSLAIEDDVAEALAKELDSPLGLIKDLSYDHFHYIVRWPDDE